MADKLMQPTWDPLVLAAQLQKIAQQSQTLMQRFVSNQPDAIKLGIGDTSSLGFDFFELMTKMMINPAAVASAQIYLTPLSVFGKKPPNACSCCAHTKPMLRKINASSIRNGARMPSSAL